MDSNNLLKSWIPINKIDWRSLSGNNTPEAIKLLEENGDEIDWGYLSANTATEAVKLLERNPNNIVWQELSGNTNSRAIELLINNPDEIDWWSLSSNPNPEAINLLENNIDKKIDWDLLSGNPGIFNDFNKSATITQKNFRKSKYYNEWRWHPQRLYKKGYFNHLSESYFNEIWFGKKRMNKKQLISFKRYLLKLK
jgi:hypothetical protein